MSRTWVVLSLFLAASVGFAAPARAQYNAPGNQYDLQRVPPQDAAQPQDIPQQPLDIPQQILDTPQQPLDRPYRIDQACPSCR
jgi:hypothetical protein